MRIGGDACAADTAGAHVTQVQVLCRRSEEEERDLAPGRRAHGRIGAGETATRRAQAQKGTDRGGGVSSLSCPCPLPHSSHRSQCRGGVQDRGRREIRLKVDPGFSSPSQASRWAVADAAAGR